MNTNIKISLYTDISTIKCYEYFDDAYAKFDYVMKKFSRFDEKSELSKINNKRGEKIQLDNEMFKLISFAIELANKSDGLFDPTIIDILEGYGYDQKKNIRFDKKEIQSILENRKSFREIHIDSEKKTLIMPKSQKLDLGSIAKGYAIDLASEALSPVKNYLINAGGDVFANGMFENKDWKVGLTKGNSDEIFGFINLSNSSLSSSGSWANQYNNFHHIINPVSGDPQNECDYVFVHHPKSYISDGYATLLFLMGSKGLNILEKEKVGGMVVKDGEAFSNSFFPEIFFD